jgi:O-antigen/teichoic acid export membrane protein
VTSPGLATAAATSGEQWTSETAVAVDAAAAEETAVAVDGGRVDGRRVVSSVASSMAGKAAELLTLVLLATLVPRALGPGDYGRFAVPLTIVTVGSLALTLGGPTTMARFVPAEPPGERPAVARRLGARLARGRAVQLVAVALAAAVAALVDPDAFPPAATAAVVVALALNVATTLALQVDLGLGRTAAWSLRYPLHNIVLVVAVLVLHPVAGDGGALAAVVLAALATTVLVPGALRPLRSVPAAGVPAAVSSGRRPDGAVPDGAVRFGVLQAGGAALVQLAQRGGVLAVAVLAGSAVETGHAALAAGIALGVTAAVAQAFTVSLPHVAAAGGSGLHAEATLRRLAGALLAVLVPAAAVVVAVRGPVVPAVFGDRYEGAAGAFVPAMAMVVLAPLNALAVQLSALRMQPRAALAVGVATAAVFVATALVAVPRWEATGATAAALAGVAAGAAVSVALLGDGIGRRVAVGSVVGAAAVVAVGLIT